MDEARSATGQGLPIAAIPSPDHSAARRFMVLGQVTPNGVTDPLLIQAMGEVPRELFVPAAQQHRAYADAPVPLAGGRAMLTPMLLARMIQLLLPQPGERALVLGAGSGYGAAVLARMGLAVVAIEEDPALVAAARSACAAARLPSPPTIVEADPAAGQPAGAPFRVMLVEGAVERLPAALTAQLGEGGRLVCVRGGGPVGRVVLVRRAGGALGEQWAFEASAPVLPAFAEAPRFAL